MKRCLSALLLLGLLLGSATAHGATWSDPRVTALAGSLVKGAGGWLELPRFEREWGFGMILLEAGLSARTIERLPDGHLLVTTTDGLGVYELDKEGTIVWSFTSPSLSPSHAIRLPGDEGHTLITSTGEQAVLEIDKRGDVVWRLDTPGDGDRLVNPQAAIRTSTGTTLITDRGSYRVIEVDTNGEVVWHYGTTGERSVDHGHQVGYLDGPTWATRIANGNTLIADYDAHRVLEVTPDGRIAWSYGQAGNAGVGPGYLNHPVSAERLADGSTLIADSGNGRLLVIASNGTIARETDVVSEYGLSDLDADATRWAQITLEGKLALLDDCNSRLFEIAYAASGSATSGQIDCGLPGVRKRFTGLSAAVTAPEGTDASLQYRIDGGAWKTASGGSLPAETYGTLLTYRVTLTTDDPAVTPRLTGVSIGYQPAPAQSPGDGDGDDDDDDSPGTGSGTARPRPSTRPRPRVPMAPRGPISGIMNPSEGYASSQFGEPGATLEGPVSTRSGWTMARVNTEVDIDSLASTTPAPLPSPEGLILLGGLYAAGALSVPLGRAARAAASFVPTDY